MALVLDSAVAFEVVQGDPADRDRKPEGQQPEEQDRAGGLGTVQPGRDQPGGQRGLHGADAAGGGDDRPQRAAAQVDHGDAGQGGRLVEGLDAGGQAQDVATAQQQRAADALDQLAGVVADLDQPGQDLVQERGDPGPQQPPAGRHGHHGQGQRDQPGQHEVGPGGRAERFLVGRAGDGDEGGQEQDVQDEGDELADADAGRGDRGRDLPALQVADVEGGAADGGRGDQGDEGPGHLGQHGPDEGQRPGHEAGQLEGGAHVGQRGQAQRDQAPPQVRPGQDLPEAGPGQLAREQVGRGHRGDQGGQAAQPDPPQP